MPQTAIIILNWNTRNYLEKFLPGVLQSAPDADVVVADNASSDGSAELLAEKFPGVRVIRFRENFGFTGGYNRALKTLESDGYKYYVLMNTDIEVKEKWLEPLEEWMDGHPECGACAPKLHSWHEPERFEYAGASGGFIDALGYPFCRGRVMGMTELDKGQYDSGPEKVFWATGACLMVRAAVFHTLGGFDDRFFAHMEEIDLCWRMQLCGYSVVVVPESAVLHIGGGTLPADSPWKLKLNYRNNLLMLDNNLSRTFAAEIIGQGKQTGQGGQEVHAAARKACRKAELIIFTRMILDGLSAFVYLLGGKKEAFRAVLTAHREFLSMRSKDGVQAAETYLQTHGGKAAISGLYPHWMIPRAMLLKERFFAEIRNPWKFKKVF